MFHTYICICRCMYAYFKNNETWGGKDMGILMEKKKQSLDGPGVRVMVAQT